MKANPDKYHQHISRKTAESTNIGTVQKLKFTVKDVFRKCDQNAISCLSSLVCYRKSQWKALFFAQCSEHKIQRNSSDKLLEVKISNQLSFYTHQNQLIKKFIKKFILNTNAIHTRNLQFFVVEYLRHIYRYIGNPLLH